MPSIFERVLGALGLKAGGSTNAGIQLYPSSSGMLHEGETVPYEKLLAQAKGWVYSCIRVIAEEIGLIELHLYRVTKEGWVEVHDHPILDLLNAPNPYMTSFELKEVTSMHLDLTGNCYWLLDGVKDAKSTPSAIWPLPPDKIKPNREKLPVWIDGYTFRQDGKTKRYENYEVLHFREPNPNDLYMGAGAAQAAADAIDSDNWAREWNRKFFQNAGWPGLVLKANTNDEATMQQLRISFDDRYRGAGRAHKTAVLPKGVEIEKIGFSQKDMDFVNLRTAARDEILGLFRVPHVVLGLGAGENLNRATADMTDYVFARRTIRPKMQRLVNYLNEHFVPRFGADLVLDFDNPVPEDMQFTLQSYKESLGGNPYKSVNEVRREIGLPEIENGDKVMIGSGLTPLGGEAAGGDGAEPPDSATEETSLTEWDVRKKGLKVPRFKKNADKREAFSSEVAKRALEIVAAKLKDIKSGQTDWSEYWKGVHDSLLPFEKEIHDAMVKYNGRMIERAMASVDSIAAKALKKSDILDSDEEVADIVTAVTPTMKELLGVQGSAAARLVGSTFDPEAEATQAALGKSIDRMATKYTQETLDMLKSELNAGIADGESIDKLKDRVAGVGSFSDDVRAERVAKTGTFRTSNLASREAWQQSGVVTTLVWHTQSDNPCEYCDEMDGQEVGIDETWYDVGDTIQGSSGGSMEITYADGEEPNIHPNCQCIIRPGEISVTGGGSTDDNNEE